MIVAIAALEENLINPENSFECNGFTIRREKFLVKYSGHGSTNF